MQRDCFAPHTPHTLGADFGAREMFVADVFVSYKRENEAMVSRLVTALSAHGLTVWWDRALEHNADFGTIIDGEIDAAKAVVVCWTGAAATRDGQQINWVIAEASRAAAQSKYCGALFESCLLPSPFGGLNAADLTGWTGQADHLAFLKLLGTVGRLTGRTDIEDRARAQAQVLDDTEAQRKASDDAERIAQTQREQSSARDARSARLRDKLEPGKAWRLSIPGVPDEALPLLVTLPPGRITGPDQFNEYTVAYVYEQPFALTRTCITYNQWKYAARAGAKPRKRGAYDPAEQNMAEQVSGRGGETYARAGTLLTVLGYIDWLNGLAKERLGEEAMTFRLPRKADWAYGYCAGLESKRPRKKRMFEDPNAENDFGLIYRPDIFYEWTSGDLKYNSFSGGDNGVTAPICGWVGASRPETALVFSSQLGWIREPDNSRLNPACFRLITDIVD